MTEPQPPVECEHEPMAYRVDEDGTGWWTCPMCDWIVMRRPDGSFSARGPVVSLADDAFVEEPLLAAGGIIPFDARSLIVGGDGIECVFPLTRKDEQ